MRGAHDLLFLKGGGTRKPGAGSRSAPRRTESSKSSRTTMKRPTRAVAAWSIVAPMRRRNRRRHGHASAGACAPGTQAPSAAQAERDRAVDAVLVVALH